MMAAKGLVPVRGQDQITLLVQLSVDSDANVAKAAQETLRALPPNVLVDLCAAPLHPAVLHRLSQLLSDQNALGNLVANANTTDATINAIAKGASESLCERIAVNEARLLSAPEIIESIYKNRNARMSTADRLVELAARNGLELAGIPAFKDHVEALQGQLIPEPSDEVLPQDAAFASSLDSDSDVLAIERNDRTGTEELKEQFKPLTMQIADMTKAEKLRLALIGNATARSILVRDNNRQIAFAAVSSPQMTVSEAIEVAKSRDVSEEILRYVGNKREWVKSGEVKHNLVFNPKTPVGISMKFLSHLRLDELRQLARNRNVPAQLRSLAGQWVSRKEKR